MGREMWNFYDLGFTSTRIGEDGNGPTLIADLLAAWLLVSDSFPVVAMED